MSALDSSGAQALMAACDALGACDLSDDIVAVQAVQEGCSAILALGAAGSLDAHLDTLLLTLTRLGKTLQALNERLAGGGVCAACEDALWSDAVLPLVDVLLYSKRWNEMVLQQGELGKQLQEMAKCFIRDAVTPALCTVVAKCAPGSALALAGTYSALLNLGTIAAALVGYQCTRTIDLSGRTGLTPYVALNLMWHGIARLWTATPQAARRQLLEQGMGIAHLLKMLCGFLKQDVEALAEQADLHVPRRMQFWLSLVNKLAVACPEGSSAAWEALLKWQVYARQRLGSLGPSHGGREPAEDVLGKASKCLVVVLGHISSEDTLKVSVDRLRARMLAGHEPGGQHQAQALPTVLVAVDILLCAAVMKPRARLLCTQLVSAVVEALLMPACAAALDDPALPQRVAEGILVFLVACCNACRASEEDYDTLLRAQRQLFLLALQPHPLVVEVLARCWGDLIRLSDRATAQQHIVLLHQLLQAAVQVEGGSWDASPLVPQLTVLLANLLCAAPRGLAESYIASSLQVSPAALADASQRACLSANLHLATLVDAAAGGSMCSPAVQAALHKLCAMLHSGVSCGSFQQLAQQPGNAPEVVSFTRLVDCIEQASGYMASNDASGLAGSGTLRSLAADLVQACIAQGPGQLCWAAPALRALLHLSGLPGSQSALADAELDALLPALEELQQHPETAACAAALGAAYRQGCVVPTNLFHRMLSEEDPLLQFAAMEAYMAYVRKCDRAVVHALLPPAMRDPETGAMTKEQGTVAAQHLGRRPSGGPVAGPQQLQDWAVPLQAVAGDAVAQLAARAKVAAAALECGNGPDCLTALQVAAGALCVAIEQLQQAAGSCQGQLDADTLQRLQECSTRLDGVLAGRWDGESLALKG